MSDTMKAAAIFCSVIAVLNAVTFMDIVISSMRPGLTGLALMIAFLAYLLAAVCSVWIAIRVTKGLQ
jgi:hypothetical protein